METPSLDKMIEEIEKLKEAKAILDTIYSEVGPYNREKISEKTSSRLNKFYDFDDSE